MKSVQTGLDRLVRDRFKSLSGLRVGLVAHPASVDCRLSHVVDAMLANRVNLKAIFGPEHGILGHAQDLIGVADSDDPHPGIRVHSLYGQTVESLHPQPEQFRDLDLLVIDLQDIGSRYYTFQATMLFCLEVAAKVGLKVMVLDRPNPLGGVLVEGPGIDLGYESFVGPHSIATRHALTIGELARLYRHERKIDVDLEVVSCEGWSRELPWEATGLPWVLPSPNMPTVNTALVYPGQCLIEGTNLSEGRGTTRPFELCGFPGVDSRKLAQQLNAMKMGGVIFRPASFQPTFQKHAGQVCDGVQLHVTDPKVFRPLRASLALLIAFRNAVGDRFRWRTEVYEFVSNPIAIDLLFGSSREREAIEAGVDMSDIAAGWIGHEREYRDRVRPFWLYET